MPNREPSPRPESRPSPFRVGAPDRSYDYVMGGARFYEWQATDTDAYLSRIAGWGKLILVREGQLELPISVRSASSVLSGTEAFPGEKDEVVRFMVDYTGMVRKTLQATDVSLALDTVAVMRGSKDKLVVPPHTLETDAEAVAAWYSALDEDLAKVLEQEPRREELLAAFHNGMQSLETER